MIRKTELCFRFSSYLTALEIHMRVSFGLRNDTDFFFIIALFETPFCSQNEILHGNDSYHFNNTDIYHVAPSVEICATTG